MGPTLDEFLVAAREDNPGVPDTALKQHWNAKYGHVNPNTLPSWETFLPAAKEDNPDVPEDQLRSHWENNYGVFGAREQEDKSSDVKRGFTTAFKQIPQLAYGVEAGIGALGEKIFGEGGLATGIKEHGVKNFEATSQELAATSKPTDEITVAYDRATHGDPGALADWLQYVLGYTGGQVLQSLATLGVGAVGGKIALQPVASAMAQKLVAKEAARLGATETGLAASELTKRATANVASRLGQTVALAATATGMEGGEIYGDLVSKAEQEGRDLTGDELAKAFGATLSAGALEFVGDKIGLDLILGKTPLSKISGRVGRGAASAVADAVAEGGTEAAQTLLEEYGKGNDPFSDASIEQALNAAALGAVGGAAVGGGAGIIQRAAPTPTTPTALPAPEQTALPATPPALPADDPTKKAIEAVGVTDPGVGIDEAIKRAFHLSTAPTDASREATKTFLAEAARAQEQLITQEQAARLEPEKKVSAEIPILEGPDQPIPPSSGMLPAGAPQPSPAAMDTAKGMIQRIVPGTAYTPRQEEPALPSHAQAERTRRPEGEPAIVSRGGPLAYEGMYPAGAPRPSETAKAAAAESIKGIEATYKIPKPTEREKLDRMKMQFQGAAVKGVAPTPTAMAETASRLDAKSGTAEGKAEVDQPVGDGVLTDSKLFGDGPHTQTLLTKGFKALDRKTQQMVVAHVRAGMNDHQVFRSVVESVPVDVMNMLVRKKRSTEELLHDPSVLTHRLAVSRHIPVPVSVARFIDSLATVLKGRAASSVAEKTSLSSRRSSTKTGPAEEARAERGLNTLPTAEDALPKVSGQSLEGLPAGLTGTGPERVEKRAGLERIEAGTITEPSDATAGGREAGAALLADDGSGHAVVQVGEQSDTANITPTDGQKEAGTYKKAHISISGLDISVENPEGSERSGVDPDGKPWRQTMRSHYGYIRSLPGPRGEYWSPKGPDKDHLDLFIRPGTPDDYKGPVFVVDQVKPDSGTFDEVKILLGFDTLDAARAGYQENYAPDWNGLGNITQTTVPQLKLWLRHGRTKKSFSKQPSKEWTKATPSPSKPDTKAPVADTITPKAEAVATKDETTAPKTETPVTTAQEPAAEQTALPVTEGPKPEPNVILANALRSAADQIEGKLSTLDSLTAVNVAAEPKAKQTQKQKPQDDGSIKQDVAPYDDELTPSQALLQNRRYALRDTAQQALNFDLATAALGALDEAGTSATATTGELGGPRTLGLGISPDLINKGVISLTGYDVHSAEDLAKLAQVYRDPRFETFRIFYLKGTTIVGHEGMSSRLPGSVAVWVGKDGNRITTEQWAKDRTTRMQALEADGYYLLHNHPDGNSDPSPQDIRATTQMMAAVEGFKGHVIIDSNEYSALDPTNATVGFTIKRKIKLNLGKDKLLESSIPHPLIGAPIRSIDHVVSLAQALQVPDEYVTVLYRSANGKTRAIQEVPVEFLLDVDTATAYFAEQARAFGSQWLYTHYKARDVSDTKIAPIIKAITELIQNGTLQDHVFEGAHTGRTVTMGSQGARPREKMVLGQHEDAGAGFVEQKQKPLGGAFKRWFGKSKVAYRNGEPIVVYHGTDKKLETFSPQPSKRYTTLGPYEVTAQASFFSRDKEFAMRFGTNIMPVYLKIEHPLDLTEGLWGQDDERVLNLMKEKFGDGVGFTPAEELWDIFDDPKIVNKLKEWGYDGAFLSERGTNNKMVEVYATFSPNQVKSATGNRGTFDPNDPSILHQTVTPMEPQTDLELVERPTVPATLKGKQQGLPIGKGPVAYEMPAMTNMDAVIRTLQDKNIDMVRLVDTIKATGAKLADEINPVLKEEMYMGRTAQRLQDFLNDELKPLIQQMRLNKISLEDFDTFLHARHAEEANRHLAEINPELEDNQALSGMTNEAAEKILKNSPPIYGKLATKVDAILRRSRELMVDYGLESQETVNQWAEQYVAYVPLHRDGFEDGLGTGQGRSIRGSHVKQRTGSKRSVIDILANVALDREKVIVRGEKMRPVIALAGLLMQHPNREIATLTKPAMITYKDPQTGLLTQVPGDIGEYQVPRIKVIGKDGTVQWIPDPQYKGRDNVVNFRIAGKDHAIVFNESNERAMHMARALKDLDVGQLNTVMSGMARVTRYLAAINTQYNPVFGVVNFVRDVQFAMIALSNTPLAGKRSAVWNATKSAILGIYRDARAVRRGEHPTSPVSQLWERFQKVGGPTGYRDLFRSSSDRADAIRHLLDPDWWQKTKAGKVLTAGGSLSGVEGKAVSFVKDKVFDWLSDYNQAMENAVRLGVFKAGIDQGMSDEQAASLAKNITVNFNKKGQISAQAGALYAFFNASVQGTNRVLETLFEKGKFGQLSQVGKKIVAGGTTLGALQAFALSIGGFDDDQPPEWLKERSLIIPVPGTEKGFVSIPMPLGFNVLPNLGRLTAEAFLYGKPMDKSYHFLASLVDVFSPVGGAASPAQFLAPTAVDHLVALSENKDWTGRQIYKEDFNSLHPTPGFTRARNTATPWARGIAELINYATGGTDYMPGKFSPTPDQLDYLITQVTGGIGREAARSFQTAESLMTGEELPTYKMPLVGRFVGSAADQSAIRDEFYQNVKRLNMLEAELKGRRQHGEDVQGFRSDHPEAQLARYGGQIEREVQSLTRRKRELLRRGASPEQVRLVDMQIRARMERLNERVQALQAQ